MSIKIIKTSAIIFLLVVIASLSGFSQSDKPKKELGPSQIKYGDSLQNVLKNNIADSSRFNIYKTLCKLYLDHDKKSSIAYGEKALDLAREKHFELNAQIFRHLGNAYDRLGKYHKAIGYIDASIKKLKDTDTLFLGLAYNYLAYLYMRNGELYKSLELYNKNLTYAKMHQLDWVISDTYSGLANVYNAIGDKEKEVEYLFLYLENAEGEDQKRNISWIEFRLADNLRENYQFEIALNHYIKALDFAIELIDTSWMVSIINRIAWNYYVMGELDSSYTYYKKSLELSIPINKITNTTNSYGNIANIFRDKGEYQESQKYYQKSIDLSIKAGDIYNLQWVYEDMSKMYAKMNEHQKAYEAYQMHSLYEDSLQQQNYEASMLEIRTRYEAEKTQKELELVSMKLKNNRYYVYGMAGVLILIIFIGILLLRQNKMKTKERISEMNHKISEITQQNLRQQMNPHFIFNTLNSIQYYVFQNDKIASNNYMTKFAALMRKTLDNSQYTSIPIKEEIDALNLYLELESLRFKGKFDWDIKVDDEIDTLLYKIPTMLIQPYVENSIGHGLMHKENGKGEIHIDLKLEEDSIKCTIEDNGIGREKAIKIKKNKNRNHNSLGTSITESRLKLVNAIYGRKMRIQYTDLKDYNGEPVGTRVVINIPIIT